MIRKHISLDIFYLPKKKQAWLQVCHHSSSVISDSINVPVKYFWQTKTERLTS